MANATTTPKAKARRAATRRRRSLTASIGSSARRWRVFCVALRNSHSTPKPKAAKARTSTGTVPRVGISARMSPTASSNRFGRPGSAAARAPMCSRVAPTRESMYSETVSSCGFGFSAASAACCCSSNHFWTFGLASNAVNSAISGASPPLRSPTPISRPHAAPQTRRTAASPTERSPQRRSSTPHQCPRPFGVGHGDHRCCGTKFLVIICRHLDLPLPMFPRAARCPSEHSRLYFLLISIKGA